MTAEILRLPHCEKGRGGPHENIRSKTLLDFSLVDKNLPPMQETQAQLGVQEGPTCRGMGCKLRTATTNVHAASVHALQQEKPTHPTREELCSLQLDRPHAATKTQRNQKKIFQRPKLRPH